MPETEKSSEGFLAEAYALACRECGVEIRGVSVRRVGYGDGPCDCRKPSEGVLLDAEGAPFSIMFLSGDGNPAHSAIMYRGGEAIRDEDDFRLGPARGDARKLAKEIAWVFAGWQFESRHPELTGENPDDMRP